jgi:hypothetical protein
MKTSVGQAARILSVVTMLGGLMLFPVTKSWAQQKATEARQQIVGVWKLVSSVNTAKDGTVTKGISFGPNPAGRFVFTGSGHYVSLNTNPNLPKFASGNRATGTAEENKAVVKGSIGSFGTYSVSADGKILALKQEGGTWALRNGLEEKRNLTLSGDDLKFTTAATVGGTSELAYKRIK